MRYCIHWKYCYKVRPGSVVIYCKPLIAVKYFKCIIEYSVKRNRIVSIILIFTWFFDAFLTCPWFILMATQNSIQFRPVLARITIFFLLNNLCCYVIKFYHVDFITNIRKDFFVKFFFLFWVYAILNNNKQSSFPKSPFIPLLKMLHCVFRNKKLDCFN